MAVSPQDILDFWYSERVQKLWFVSTPEFDEEIREKFEALWEMAEQGLLDDWCENAEGSLALAIVLDQFPLNMYRNTAKGFSTEAKSIIVARLAIEKGFDEQLDKDKLGFLLMPLMHSEDLAIQDMSVEMFKKHELEANIRFAEHHRGLIQEFGRFPHRNEMLDRTNTAEEELYLNSKRAFLG